LLDPAAGALEGKHPLAVVLLRRALIEVTLQKGRATRYKHAARHVREIDSLNAQVKDYADFETHDQFMARLLRTIPARQDFGYCCAIDFLAGCQVTEELQTPYAQNELFSG
jgi:Family of unknown function (DUF6880)